jgi:hypothetical protein
MRRTTVVRRCPSRWLADLVVPRLLTCFRLPVRTIAIPVLLGHTGRLPRRLDREIPSRQGALETAWIVLFLQRQPGGMLYAVIPARKIR